MLNITAEDKTMEILTEHGEEDSECGGAATIIAFFGSEKERKGDEEEEE